MPRIHRRRFLQSAAALALPRIAGASPAEEASPYRYRLVDGGFEIVNGPGVFNRPLPPSHANDKVRAERLVAWAGDRPIIRFTALTTRPAKISELRLGTGGRWFHEFQSIRARYNAGRYDYELSDPAVPGTVRLGLVAAVDFEGVIVKADLAGTLEYDFSPGTLERDSSTFVLRPETTRKILRGGRSGSYFWITSDPPDTPAVRRCADDPAGAFDAATRQLSEVAHTLEIHTPDPYLDALVAQETLALDRAWHEATMMHGVYSWHVALAGWRSLYGATVLGWHDRVRKHADSFFAVQVKEPELPPAEPIEGHAFGEAPACRGAIPGYLNRKSYFYNMGEVLLDMVCYDWLWSGDLEYMRRAFDAIAAKLIWQDRCIDPDGDGLYENWLNAWNTDSKWHNGGGGIIASVYTWRASTVMAEVARRLGKDPAPFLARAEKIRKACDAELWVAGKGVYAEYKDALGLGRRHEAPDQSSVYTPIDLGFCDDFQAYQMLRYTEYAMPGVRGLARGGRLLWSSNWLPEMYSTFGLYADETINTILCYFRLGLAERGYELLKGMESGALMGACPGTLALNENPDGTASGHIDFSDIISQFVRTVVDGLFGVRMNAPAGVLELQPAFPDDWQTATMRGPLASVEYSRAGNVERLTVGTNQELRHRFRLPARSAEIRSVSLNGRPAQFRVEAGVGRAWVLVENERTAKAELRIEYGNRPLPLLEAPPVGAIGHDFAVMVRNGVIREVRDPQGIVASHRIEGARCTVRFADAAGWHTFFVLAEGGQARIWLPVDVEPRAPVEIVNATASGYQVRDNTANPPRIEAVRKAMANLSPGTNRIVHGALSGSLVDWKLPAPVAGFETVSLAALVNQDLATLHEQRYVNPHLPQYHMTVQENGRSWWLNRVKKPEPRIDRIRAADGRLVSDIGVPFAIPAAGANACFTSMYENFPRRIAIPVGRWARKLYFLLAVSTNQMQSRIENGRITIHAGGGEHVLALSNPENLDDWLMDPFALSGFSQPFGTGTHGHVVDCDFGETRKVESVTLECLANEVLLGLVGLTLLNAPAR
jgi:hypothetical protein